MGTPAHIREWLTSLAPDSPANGSVHPGRYTEATPRIDGQKLDELLTSLTLAPYYLKTLKDLYSQDTSRKSSTTWPRSVIWGATTFYPLATSAATTSGLGLGLLPTPTASDWKGSVKYETSMRRASESARGVRLPEQLTRLLGYNGSMNPRFSEKMMMWPTGWTDLKPLETASFHAWSQRQQT